LRSGFPDPVYQYISRFYFIGTAKVKGTFMGSYPVVCLLLLGLLLANYIK
jgi:hypothetical protein